MFNVSGIKKQSLSGTNPLLANVEMQASVGCIASAANSWASEGNKVPAGHPVFVDFDNLLKPVIPCTEYNEPVEKYNPTLRENTGSTNWGPFPFSAVSVDAEIFDVGIRKWVQDSGVMPLYDGSIITFVYFLDDNTQTVSWAIEDNDGTHPLPAEYSLETFGVSIDSQYTSYEYLHSIVEENYDFGSAFDIVVSVTVVDPGGHKKPNAVLLHDVYFDYESSSGTPTANCTALYFGAINFSQLSDRMKEIYSGSWGEGTEVPFGPNAIGNIAVINCE